MTKEQALQKVNDYCNEKSYTSETLTEGFKDKFAEHFVKRYPDATEDDEQALSDMKFALNTAFSGASQIITEKTTAFTTKENEYKNQIAELNKKLGKKTTTTDETPAPTIPKEVQDQLDELKMYKNNEVRKTKLANIMSLAKQGVRQDLHKSFETFAQGTSVDLEKGDKEQADALVARFQAIFKDSIGDITPLKPQVAKKRDEDVMSQLKRIKV